MTLLVGTCLTRANAKLNMTFAFEWISITNASFPGRHNKGKPVEESISAMLQLCEAFVKLGRYGAYFGIRQDRGGARVAYLC